MSSNISPVIQVFVLDVGTGDLFEIPYITIQTIEELNNGGSASFTIDYAAVKDVSTAYGTTVSSLFTATFREIYVTSNGTMFWRGVISDYQRSKDVNANYTLTVAAVDYFSLFQKRRTGLTEVDFTSVDPATIPWSLINTSQLLIGAGTASDFGITEGVTASTGLTVTVAYKNAEIRQEIINLSNYNQYGSFDFNIDLTKKFNVFYPTMGTVRENIVLDDNNILADTVEIPVITSITNSVFVTGQGVNSDQAALNVQASSPTINAYKLAEDVISNVNISDTNFLTAMGNNWINLYSLPLYSVSVIHDAGDPDITTFDVGDTLITNIEEENISYAQYRVHKRTVNVDNGGAATVQEDMLTI